MPQNWYAISKTAEAVEVSIYDEIGGFGVSAKDFIQEIQAYKGDRLHVRINSPGGSVIDGTAILNALTRHQGGVTVHIDALAASMASVIAMSGAPVLMAENALLMIHNPWTIAAGDADEMRKTAGLLDRLKDNIVGAYEKKTAMARERISELMDSETWLTALEAVALGFVDAIEPEIEAFALADGKARFDRFRGSMSNTTEADPVVEPAIVEPAVVEPIAEPEAVEPIAEPTAEPTAEVEPEASVTLATALAEIKGLKMTAKIQEAEIKILNETIDALEKFKGLAPASEAPDLQSANGENPTLLDQFNAITDPAARSEFYRTHQAALRKFLNR